MTARHSAKAAERLGLKMSRLTRWRFGLKGLWTVACTDLHFFEASLFTRTSASLETGKQTPYRLSIFPFMDKEGFSPFSARKFGLTKPSWRIPEVAPSILGNWVGLIQPAGRYIFFGSDHPFDHDDT